MVPRSWRDWLWRLIGRPRERCAKPLRRFSRARLALEALEDRTVPATFPVITGAEFGPGSLRQAILDADAAAGPDVIEINPSAGAVLALANAQDFTLGPSLVRITSDITIVGSGQTLSPVPGVDARLFLVTPTGRLTLRNLTLADGTAIGAAGTPDVGGNGGLGAGGGILNFGTLVLDSVTLRNNQARGGPADPAAGGSQGGDGRGGAIFSSDGTVRIVNSTLTGNGAAGSLGAGGFPGTAQGGAIFTQDGLLEIINSTLAGNVTNSALEGGAAGGAVAGTSTRAPTQVMLVNSILADSVSPTDLRVDRGGAGLTLDIRAPNLIESFFVGDSVNQLGAAIVSGDPLLDVLNLNGGPTPTIPLRAGSPALAAGTLTAAPQVDQRGVPRLRGVNLGAYQASATQLIVDSFNSPQNAGDPDDFRVRALDPFGQPAVGPNLPLKFDATPSNNVVLPGPATLVGGAGSFPARFFTPGTYTLTATEVVPAGVVQAAATGSQLNIVIASPLGVQTRSFVATQGQLFDGQVATFVPAGPGPFVAGQFEATIDWGDGTAPTPGVVAAVAGGTFTVSGSHTYVAEDSFVVKVTVRDILSEDTEIDDGAAVVVTAAQARTLADFTIALAEPGAPVTIAAIPGLAALLTQPLHSTAQPILFLARYQGNPTPLASAGVVFYDVRLTDSDPAALLAVTFGYPGNGNDQVVLEYFNSHIPAFVVVQGSTRVAPGLVVNQATQTILVFFDDTSVPTLAQLGETVFTISVTEQPTPTLASVSSPLALVPSAPSLGSTLSSPSTASSSNGISLLGMLPQGANQQASFVGSGQVTLTLVPLQGTDLRASRASLGSAIPAGSGNTDGSGKDQLEWFWELIRSMWGMLQESGWWEGMQEMPKPGTPTRPPEESGAQAGEGLPSPTIKMLMLPEPAPTAPVLAPNSQDEELVLPEAAPLDQGSAAWAASASGLVLLHRAQRRQRRKRVPV